MLVCTIRNSVSWTSPKSFFLEISCLSQIVQGTLTSDPNRKASYEKTNKKRRDDKSRENPLISSFIYLNSERVERMDLTFEALKK